MRITQGEIVDLQTVLHIELEDEEVRPYIDIGYQKVKPLISYPGFRKGRVPRHIALQMLGRETLLNEVLDTMLPEVTGRAIDEQQIQPGGMPEMEVLNLDPVTFTATVPLRPEVELGDYKDIRVEVEQAEVGEEQIEERLERLRGSVASWEPVERPVAMGDMVTMTATGTVEGDTILDETDTVYLLVEDADRPFPGFAEALVGAEIDTPSEFDLTVADDFPVDEVAGQQVQVSVTVSDIKERIMPELDDEFAKSIGEGYDSLEALRGQVVEELNAEAENAAAEELRESAIDSLIEGATATIAPVIIQHEVNYMLNEQAQTLARINIRMDDYMRSIGSTEAELREQMREQAEMRIKRAAALERLGEAEDIDVEDDEVDERIQTIIDVNREQNPDAPETPEITDDMRANIRRMMHSQKVMERLVEIAKGEAIDTDQSAATAEAGEPAESDADDNDDAEPTAEQDESTSG
ncbi:MAG: trigger factor [Chloroflexi bacterium]|nr:trigger factor [Chloroflexota bacterium]